MILENYQYDIDEFEEKNSTIIVGDDLIMSSEYADLDLSSQHAEVEWDGKPISWKDADFCSVKFEPNIHHSPQKVFSTFEKRRNMQYQFHPVAEMQRLGGLIRLHAGRQMYDYLLKRMEILTKTHDLEVEFQNQYISYEEVFQSYNLVLKSTVSQNKKDEEAKRF